MLGNWERVARVMEEHGLDAIIASTPANVSYLTDIPRLPEVTDAVDVHALAFREKGKEPAIIMPAVQIDQYARSTSTVKDVRIYGEFYYYKSKNLDYSRLSDPERKVAGIYFKQNVAKEIADSLVHVMRERGLAKGKVGFDERSIPPSRIDSFRKVMPRLRVEPAHQIFQEMRMIKTREEIERIKRAVIATEKGIQAVLEAARPGAVNRDLQLIFQTTIMKQRCRTHLAIIAGGTEGALVNYLPSDYVLKRGDVIRMDCNSLYENYLSDVGRNASVGPPLKTTKIKFDALLRGLEVMEATMRPGVQASKVFKVGVAAVESFGIPGYRRQNVGHSLGLQLVEPPVITHNNTTTLEENMVIALETPYYEIGFGSFNPEDTLVVNKSGCERLSKMENKLFVV